MTFAKKDIKDSVEKYLSELKDKRAIHYDNWRIDENNVIHVDLYVTQPEHTFTFTIDRSRVEELMVGPIENKNTCLSFTLHNPHLDKTVRVLRQDLLDWARDWKEQNDPGDGTDVVTPFDKYLYASKPE